MATHWGRKETIIWPPHVPVMSYMATAVAVLSTLLFMWQRLHYVMTPLQQSYMTEYVRSLAGAQFKTHQIYRMIWLGGGSAKPRPAVPVDLTKGQSQLPNGKIIPIGLSDLALAQGHRWLFRAAGQKFSDVQMNHWLNTVVYKNEGLWGQFEVAFIEGGAALVFLLCFAIPRDSKRFREMKYGRLLRGPVMLTPKQFTLAHKDSIPLRDRLERLRTFPQRLPAVMLPQVNRAMFEGWPTLEKFRPLLPTVIPSTVPEPIRGVGFKTTEEVEMMRIPERKEAHHIQIMGDTGVGKTQLIMQILRQIRQRGELAIVYDPASEYIKRFLDLERGDTVLNPLDERCPYWGPAQEMGSNAEADAIAESLYAPSTDAKDEFFHDTPAQIFAHLLKKGPSPQQLAAWMADSEKLEEMVKGTEMSFYIDRKAGPQRAGVLSSLGIVAKAFRLLPEKDDGRPMWNARTWSEQRKGWIFITSRPPERVTLRPLHSLWIDTLVMRLLTEPKPGQKKVWFVIDELASLQRLPQLHTAITENRKSGNPLVLGFQGKAQLEVIYGPIAQVMLSSPATKVFMKTAEPEAAKWISEAIGDVEIERLKETKFDGNRSGKNFTLDRQVERLVMGSEITGLNDRHAYMKLGNSVTRFAFDYLDLPTPMTGFIPRSSADVAMTFNPDTLEPIVPPPSPGSTQPPTVEEASTQPEGDAATAAKRSGPIPWPTSTPPKTARAGEQNRPAPTPESVPAREEATVSAGQGDTPKEALSAADDADDEDEIDGPSFMLEG